MDEGSGNSRYDELMATLKQQGRGAPSVGNTYPDEAEPIYKRKSIAERSGACPPEPAAPC